MKTINERWQDLVARIPAIQHAGPREQMMMKRTFFAGFMASLAAFDEVAELPAEEGGKAIASFCDQVRGFVEGMALGIN